MTTVTNDQYTVAQDKDRSAVEQEGQYTIWQILGIWLAAGAPLWALGWLVYPPLSQGLTPVEAGLLRIKLITLGLAWEFVLSMLLLYREQGNLRLETIRRRFRLNAPVSPRTGQTDRRLWWLLILFLPLIYLVQARVAPLLTGLWTGLFPFLAEPAGYSNAALFAPEVRPLWAGAWDLLGLMFLLSLFNTFLGEEFVFRGLLLPKMKGVFGKWDWLANAFLFGFYHLHQPWGIPGSVVSGMMYASTAKAYRTTWFSIILHSGQSLFFLFLILGLVLGLA